MNLRLSARILTGFAIALGTTTTLNQPNYAQSTTFFCGTSNSVPVTYARTSRGNVPIIRWLDNNSFPPPWIPQRRCQEVSQRFQRNYDNDTLKILKTETLKGYPVVCAGSSQDDPCTDRTLLFTLKRGTNSNLIVQRLMDPQGLAAGKLVNQSGSCKDDCPVYVNVDVYLKKATVEENTSSGVR